MCIWQHYISDNNNSHLEVGGQKLNWICDTSISLYTRIPIDGAVWK